MFARMLACLNHVHGWTIWGGYPVPCLKPAFSSASDRSMLLGDGPVWILVTSGSLNSNSTRARIAWFPSLPSCDAFASNGLFRVLLDRFLLPTIRPTSSNITTGHAQSALHSALQVWSDHVESYAKTPLLFLYVSKYERASSPPHHSAMGSGWRS